MQVDVIVTVCHKGKVEINLSVSNKKKKKKNEARPHALITM